MCLLCLGALVVLNADYGARWLAPCSARAYKPLTSRAASLAECELSESHLKPLPAAHGFPPCYFDRDATHGHAGHRRFSVSEFLNPRMVSEVQMPRLLPRRLVV